MQMSLMSRRFMAACAISCALIISTSRGFDATVQWNSVKQRISGFGACSAWFSKNYLPEPALTQMFDFLFDSTNGMGLSIFRAQVPWNLEDASGNWYWNRDSGQVLFMQEAKKRGVKTFWAAPWSPPPWMKTSNSSVGGSLLHANYQKYADYLSRYVSEYHSRFGIDFMGISPQNEPHFSPDWDGCVYSNAELRDFIKVLGATFARDKLNVTIIAPETNQCRDCPTVPQIGFADSIFNDPVATQYTGIVAWHQYGGDIARYEPAQSKGKEYWETETSNTNPAIDDEYPSGLAYAAQLKTYMTNANANAWHYWWFIAGDNQGLLRKTGSTFIITRRAWFLAHVSRFVRPGWYMINVTPNSFNVGSGSVGGTAYLEAFKNPATGDFAIFFINDYKGGASTCNLTFQGFNVPTVTTYQSGGGVNDPAMVRTDNVPVTNGKLSVSIPNVNVMTIVGKVPAGVSALPDARQSVDGRMKAAVIHGGLRIHLQNPAAGSATLATANGALVGRWKIAAAADQTLALPPGASRQMHVLRMDFGGRTEIRRLMF